jgi:hypothetical protein
MWERNVKYSNFVLPEMPVTMAGARSRGASIRGREMAQRPVCVCDEMQELYERWYSLCLAPRREQAVSKMILVFLPPVVLAKENLNAMPHALYGVCVIAGVRVAEVDAVTDSAMRIILRTEIVVLTPAVTNDHCAGLDPVLYGGQKCVGCSVLDGTRNVCLDSRSTLPNTHWPLTGCPLWYFRRPNLLSSISTVLLGPPILTELHSKYTSMTSLQNMPQSANVYRPKRYSLWIWWACSRQTMLYVRSNVSRRVRLICWNQYPSLIDRDWQHLIPAPLLQHHQRKHSEQVCSVQHIINRPQVSHSTSLRISSTSCRKWMGNALSQKRYAKNNLFGPPPSRSNPRPYENGDMKDSCCTRMYCVMTCCTGSSKKMDGIWNRYNLKSTRRIYMFGILKFSEKFKVLHLPQYISIKIKLNLNSGGARPWHGNRKWVTLRRWGDVHAGGESCARVNRHNCRIGGTQQPNEIHEYVRG